MGFDQSKWVWMNGKLISWSSATIHVSVHGLHYGSGVFEGLRCYETTDGPALFRLDEHLTRWYTSARVYGIEIPYSAETLTEAICVLVRENDFRNCYVRPICFYGSGSLGLHPANCPLEVAILAWPWAAYLGNESLSLGVRVAISPWVKFHSRMMPTTAKACGQYLNSILAVREAVASGYDEALLLDVEGHIAEGPGENVFIVQDGHLLTNDANDSILMGVTRECVIEIAEDLGLPVEVGTLRLEDLLTADEAFFTGTATEIAPIREVDGKVIGKGSRGEITSQIQKIFFNTISGREEKYRHWLTPVSQIAETVV